MGKNLERRLLIVVLLLSAAVRILFFFEIKDTDLATVPLLDSQAYHEWALDLIAGNWGWYETYWMGPLYPHLIALVYAVFGVQILGPVILQLALSLLNIWLVFRLGKRLLESDRESAARFRGAGLLAAALFSLYGAPVFYAGMLLMATVVTTLFLVITLQAIRAWDRPLPRVWFELGLLVGLGAVARGNLLILAAALPVFFWRAGRPSGRRWKPMAALWLGCLLMLAPVTLRNLIVADDFVILTSNGGVNLLIGQQAEHKGIFAQVMDRPQGEYDPSMETTLERELGRDLKGSEVSRILTGRAWDLFTRDLARMPLHYLRKTLRFWSGYELPQIVSYDHWKHEFLALKLLPVPSVVFLALGLIGLKLVPGRARWIIGLMIGAYFLSLLPFFPTSRYRLPVIPLLAIPSAALLLAMVRRQVRLRTWLPATGLMVALLWPGWTALESEEVTWLVHLHQASRSSKKDDLRATLAYGRQAEAARPGLADTPFHLALYLEDLQAREQALAALRLAESRAPEHRLIPSQIGRNLEELERWDEALAAYARATALDPGWSYPWLRTGLVQRRAGRQTEAVAAMEKAFALAPGNRRIRSNLASLYGEMGNIPRARQLLVDLTTDYPFYVNGWFNLALLEWRDGRPDEARSHLERAMALRNLTDRESEQIRQLATAMDAASGTAPE